MDIGFNHKSMKDGPLSGRVRSAARRPDWHGLRARLIAGRAACLAFGDSGRPGGPRTWGSFDGASARRIASYPDGTAFVNPTVSADGNWVEDKGAAAAGDHETGDRG